MSGPKLVQSCSVYKEEEVPKNKKIDKLLLYVNYKMFCRDIIFKTLFCSQIICDHSPAAHFHFVCNNTKGSDSVFMCLGFCVWV